jgi:hypothetical protein
MDRRSFLTYMAVVLMGAVVLVVPSFMAADMVPQTLSDEAFWRLVSDYSETSVHDFRFEYMSNEQEFLYVINRLKENRKPGGVYIGVGPEQNFTYISAIQPKMAFIVDIRRENMLEHLLYKAVFELSANRVDFLSRLFARKTPAGLGEKPAARALLQAFDNMPPDPNLYRQNLQAIRDQLLKVHKFQLNAEDQNTLDYIYRVFADSGNAFALLEMMMATDEKGQMRSYLASEENFQVVREMEKKNLIVPVVGDFAGSKALRSVGRYVKDHGATVTAMYTSNVEQYLYMQGDDWRNFMSNVATFPLDAQSMFIRSSHFSYGNTYQPPRQFGGRRFIQLLSPMAEVVKAFNAGKVTSYEDVIKLSK